MKRLSEKEMKEAFIGWQCRIRQLAMRDYEGRPLPGMAPCVSAKNGEVLVPALITLLIHKFPQEVTDHLKFVVQKTNDPQKIREAGLRFLAGDYYQQPELFSDHLTAVFSAAPELASSLVAQKALLLSFTQYNQTYRMACAVKPLSHNDPARSASLWHNRLFNPMLGNSAEVIVFIPNWKTAQAEPLPSSGS